MAPVTAFRFSDADYLIYVVAMNYLTIFSGVLFLLAFILLGLVALRFTRVFGVKTYWPLFFIGPLGALVYSVYTIVHGGGPSGSAAAYVAEKWIAYCVFLLGGVVCLLGMRRLWMALGQLKKEGRKVAERYAQGTGRQ